MQTHCLIHRTYRALNASLGMASTACVAASRTAGMTIRTGIAAVEVPFLFNGLTGVYDA